MQIDYNVTHYKDLVDPKDLFDLLGCNEIDRKKKAMLKNVGKNSLWLTSKWYKRLSYTR